MIFYLFFSRALCLRLWTQAKDGMGVKQGLREDRGGGGWGGGGSVKWGSHMCDTSPEEAGLSPRGWWNLFTEPNKAEEKAI